MAKEKYISDEQYRQGIKDIFRVDDAYTNPMLNMGYGTASQMNSTKYVPNYKQTWDFMTINSIERSEPLFRKIVDYKASALLNGIDITTQELTNEETKLILVELKKVYKSMYDFIYQAIFYGGGAGMLIFRGDDEEEYMKPLDLTKIKKDSFLGIKPLERWYDIVPCTKKIDELGKDGIDDPSMLGFPLYYDVKFGGKNSKSYRVHTSRLLFYNTGHLPYIQKNVEQFWGVSEVEILWDTYNRYITAINAVINMFIISNTRVLKMEDTTGSAQMTERAMANLKSKFELMKESLNFSNILVIDKEDDFEYANANLGGVPEVLKQIRQDFCSSAQVPSSYIFSDSFESAQDGEQIHKPIKNNQKLYIEPMYRKLIAIICKSALGREMPKNIEITFSNIKEISDKDRADIISKIASALIEVYKVGAMDTETFIRSLSEINSNPSDVFDNYSEQFIKENADVTYIERQIALARALNKPDDAKLSETNGGNNNELLKKPTPRVDVGS